MRILRSIVEPTAHFVPLGRNTDILHRRRICPKPISDDVARSPVFLHYPLEKLQRRGLVPLCGDHPLQDLALMIDRAPKITEPAVDLHEDPRPNATATGDSRAYAHAALTNLGGEHRTKPVPPEPDGLMADVDPALG